MSSARIAAGNAASRTIRNWNSGSSRSCSCVPPMFPAVTSAARSHRDEREAPRASQGPELQELRGEEACHAPRSPGSPVSSRKTSSSVARSADELVQDDAVGSRDLADLLRTAQRPTRRPSPTLRRPGPPRPAAQARRSASGERTVVAPAAIASTSAIATCRTSFPRWMITTSSTVCATSARTWLEMRIVRPSLARRTKEVTKPADALRVEPVRGLVEHEHLGIAEQRRGETRGAVAFRASSP